MAPEESSAAYNVAASYHNSQYYTEAVKWYRETLRRDPNRTDRQDILRAIDRRVIGTLHCVGAEHIHRVSLARRAVAAFGLDETRLAVGPPPADAEGPYDTSLDATYTAEALGVELRGVDSLLTELRNQLEEAWSAACTT